MASAVRHPRLLRLAASFSRRKRATSILLRSFATEDEKDKADFEAWQPPNKPLVGDTGQSYRYSHVTDAMVLQELENEMKNLDEQDEDDEEATSDSALLEENPDDEAWVRPKRPLSAAKQQVHVDDEVDEVDEMELGTNSDSDDDDDDEGRYRAWAEKQTAVLEQQQQIEQKDDQDEAEATTDWLKTRREMLSGGAKLMTPSAAQAAMKAMTDLPVKKHTLLSAKDILGIAEAMGGQNIKVILDSKERPRLGGAVGIILVTMVTHTQRLSFAQTVKRQLRRRDLHQVGVVGAEYGIEGNLDDANETWLVIDCHNYVVHILQEETRTNLNLEKLWTGQDGLLDLELNDEDAVDDYVQANPVPKGHLVIDSSWEDKLKQLKKKRATAPKPESLAKKKRSKRSRRGRKT